MQLDNKFYLYEKSELRDRLEEKLGQIYVEHERRGLINSGSLISEVSRALKKHLQALGTSLFLYYDIIHVPEVLLENEIETEINYFIKKSPGHVVPNEFYSSLPNYRLDMIYWWKTEAEKQKLKKSDSLKTSTVFKGPVQINTGPVKQPIQVQGTYKTNMEKKVKWLEPAIIIPILATVIFAPTSPWWFPKISHMFLGGNRKIMNKNIAYDGFRALEPLETGKKISELPNNVFFYAGALSVVYEVQKSDSDIIEASNKALPRHSFELQKLDKQYYIIGYISDEDYSKIGSVSESNSLSTVVYPNAWGGAKKCISVPFTGIKSINTRTVNLDALTDMSVLDLVLVNIHDGISHNTYISS